MRPDQARQSPPDESATGNLLADLLLAPAHHTPAGRAIDDAHGNSWTHADLDRRSAQLAHTLAGHGVGIGDRVVVHHATKSAEVIAVHLAVIRAGAVYVPLNSAYTASEAAALIDDAEPAMVITDPPDAGPTVTSAGRPNIQPTKAAKSDPRRITLERLLADADDRPTTFDNQPRQAADPAAILYTSGTTGRPKGAVMSHGNLTSAARTLAAAWEMDAADRLLHILPLFHTHGLFVAVHLSLLSGASIDLRPSFDPLDVINRLASCTVLMAVPTHYSRLLADERFTDECCASVRLFTSGSAPMSAATHHAFTARTGRHIVERYGMTETCMLTSNPLRGPYKPGTVGPPLPGVELRIAAEPGSTGGIEVRGPNVFAGYWRRPNTATSDFTADGWFVTGDLGLVDDDGYVEIVGRSKDLIISGGLNVYPKEVEVVIDSIGGVTESAVIGLADDDFGEVVVAVVTVDGSGRATPEAIRHDARQHLAGFKVPKRVVIVDELPRNAMGKVEKARLRASLASPPT